MLNRSPWQISRLITSRLMLRHALVAIAGAAALGTAVPAQAELTVEAAGRLPSELTADVEAAPSSAELEQATPEQVTPEQLAPTLTEAAATDIDVEPDVEPGAAVEAEVETEVETDEAKTERQTTGVAPLDLEPLDPDAPPPAPTAVLEQSPEQPAAEAEFPAANRRLVIRLAQRRVFVYEGETAVADYPVAIGRAGWETPKGEFEIFQMLKDPSWQHPWNGSIVPPGPDNPLGRRWIGFWTDGVNSIGFHGTPNESLVGQAVSHGCVRMKNADVADLFAMVDHGTTVVVE